MEDEFYEGAEVVDTTRGRVGVIALIMYDGAGAIFRVDFSDSSSAYWFSKTLDWMTDIMPVAVFKDEWETEFIVKL